MPSSDSGMLSEAQRRQFYRDGYLMLPDFFNAAPLLAHSKQLVSSVDLSAHPLTKFVTGDGDGDEHVGNAYFLTSGDKIRYFFEEGAVDAATGQLSVPMDRAVNKCGHGLHIHDKEFRDFTFSERLRNVAQSLGAHKDPRVLQSMVICKQPSIGGAVPSHNDSTFLYTNPPSAIGFWFALEDCTTKNGCLSFLPKSHRWPRDSSVKSTTYTPLDPPGYTEEFGVPRGINKRFVRKVPSDPTAGTDFETFDHPEETQWDEKAAEIAECKAGTLVLIHGSVLHKSEKNTSAQSRFVYTFHMIEGDTTRAHYDDKNWLQPSTPADSFTPLFTSGS